MATISIKEFLSRHFDAFELPERWAASFGAPERNFKCIIYGKPGNGKTEFAIQLTKMLGQTSRVYYNSFEQGISKTLQDCLVRNRMAEVNEKVRFGDKESFAQMMARLKRRNSPQIVVIDSRDYINLTALQFKILCDAYPKKAIVVICWESAGKPKGEHAKAIEYMCDVKINVRDFVAHVRSRFGGNAPFDIWPERPRRYARQGQLF